jgi:hypothetical protein
MLEGPQHARDEALGLADIDLHRVDLAARLLAYKRPGADPEALIEQAAAEARRGGGVILLIAALIRGSAELEDDDPGARERTAALRLAALLAATRDDEELSALRALLRRGEFERPLSSTSLRRLRRLCRAAEVGDAPAPIALGLAEHAWDALLDAFARSLAVDPEDEVRADLELEGQDEPTRARRRARVRAAIARGAARPGAPRRSSLGGRFGDRTLTSAIGVDAVPPEREQLTIGQKIGRFTLLQRLGVGAMGVVYAAYDPELDRRIAVKLLRAGGPRAARAQARLIREAQAMARVSHPNVVVVHDVGTHAHDVFVAMEFIRGQTLQQWLREQVRPWPAVVDAFVQAGRGLAAAHAAGLVHRDFKPSNVMIDDDGRVRVLDFGLCFAELGSDGEGPPADPRITRGGEVLGTPAYMAPEQFRGAAVGAASDQFSFCASLYEALYDQLPFAGETVEELAVSVSRGELRPPPRVGRVPPWLHAVVTRGLRPDPRARFASMDALLRALTRRGARARSRALAVAGVAGLAALAGFWTARGAEDACSGGAAEIAAVWGPERRRAVEDAFAAAGPAFAAEVWPRVAADLDRYADDWRGMHRAACEAHRRGEHSSALLDRRMACLAQRRAALAEAATVFAEADHDVALRAIAVVSDLPAVARCGDIAALAAEVPPPDDPTVRARVDEQRARLARVHALDQAGRGQAAAALADAVVQSAESLGDRALLAEALLQRVALGIHGAGPSGHEEATLTRAYLTALGGGLDELATEALALRLYVRGRSGGAATGAFEDLAVAREMTARRSVSGRTRGLVLNNAGALHLARGDAARAETMFREALVAREAALGPDHVDVAFTLVNLAIVRQADARERMQRAVAILDRRLGLAHPQTVEVRLAASLHDRDPDAARALLAPGCDALDRLAPDDHDARARCLGHLGHHAAEAGDEAGARAAFTAVAGLLRDEATTRLPALEAAQLRGRAALYTGEHRDSVARLRAGLPADGAATQGWQRRHHAELALLLALHLQALGLGDEARTAAAAAVAGYEQAQTGARDVLLQQRLAAARLTLAELLIAGPQHDDARARADAQLDAAERWYAGAGPGYAWRLRSIAALRERSP